MAYVQKNNPFKKKQKDNGKADSLSRGSGASLKQELKDKGQFPYGKRDRAYQSIDGEPGIRDMEHRYDIINFPKSFDGETVIDFGCSVGAICIDAKRRGAKRVVGLDFKAETIQVAKGLAKELNLEIIQKLQFRKCFLMSQVQNNIDQ